jgi:RNA polymerase sigma factor (sigma-70 family)
VEELVAQAKSGDRVALGELVSAVADDVYGLAIRMLWHPHDAEDATQEILVKVITSLGTFRGEAAFRTWVFRIATNHLISTRRRRAEQPELSFEAFGADLAEGLDARYDDGGVDESLLAEEVKIGCTQGMLLCLDREHRAAYVIGEVFELPSEQAAYVLGVTAAAYRKRLSRARTRIQSFMRGHCGLVDAGNACRCTRRIGRAVELGRLDPHDLLFAGRPAQTGRLRRSVAEMELLTDAAAVFRSHPDYRTPERVIAALRRLLEPGRLGLMEAEN